MKKMKLGKASGLSEVSMKMINGSEKVEIDVKMKLYQRVLDKKGRLGANLPGKRRCDELQSI